MKLKIFLLFLSIMPFNSPLQAKVWETITHYFKGHNSPEAPTLRLLIFHDVKSANLEVADKYSLYDPFTNKHISSRFAGKSHEIHAESDGLKWGESFPGLYQLKVKPSNPATSVLVNDMPYGGEIYVYDIGGTISIVNQIPVEEYIRTLLLPYQNQNLEPETLAALAIAARTQAYFQGSNPKNPYWAVDAEKVNYRGRTPCTMNIENAIKATRHMIMSKTGVYEKVATPFPAQFEGGIPLKEVELSQLSLADANTMALKEAHAGQILAKAFPGATIMLMQYTQP